MSYNEISTTELKSLPGKDNVKIIDARPIDAYNGWKLQNEIRGGHIKGAKTLPAKWTNYMDWIEIVRSKNINPEHKIIVYGYDDEQIIKSADTFKKNGYKYINIYKHFLDEWVTDSSLPMERLERYKFLVYPEWVKKSWKAKLRRNITEAGQ